MRYKLLPAATMLLWIINAVIAVAEAIGLPHLHGYDSGQRLLVGIMIVATVAWMLRHQGIEYRIGYRHGRKDRNE